MCGATAGVTRRQIMTYYVMLKGLNFILKLKDVM